jgi:hypothetical protein
VTLVGISLAEPPMLVRSVEQGRPARASCRRWPRRVPGPAPALANSRASGTAPMTSSDNGQVSPVASNRRIVNRTVEGAVPIRRAISRVDIPADLNLITSRTWPIANLQVPFAKPKGGTVSEPEEASSPRAISSGTVRNDGRHRAESAARSFPQNSRLTNLGMGMFWAQSPWRPCLLCHHQDVTLWHSIEVAERTCPGVVGLIGASPGYSACVACGHISFNIK